MQQIREYQLELMASWLTDAMRESGAIEQGHTVRLFTPWIYRVWAVYDGNSIVRTFDMSGNQSERRALWNAGRAMLWAVRGY
jgi:hypothetical protein